MGFDINDRSTWAWNDAQAVTDVDYLLDPDSREYFYQRIDGTLTKQPCPSGLIFNPTAEPGPVCDWPTQVDEAAVYEWAVAHGQVTDQR